MRKYDNFCSNLAILSQADEQDLNNEFIIGGIIDKFFVQFELGWKLLKELLKYEGSSVSASGSPRAILKEAYKVYDFLDEDIWLEMLGQRNDLTHIYDGEKARKLAVLVIERYIPEFERLKNCIDGIYGDDLSRL